MLAYLFFCGQTLFENQNIVYIKGLKSVVRKGEYYMLRNLIMQPAAATAHAPAKYNSILITSLALWSII